MEGTLGTLLEALLVLTIELMVNLDPLCALCVFVANVAVKGNNRFFTAKNATKTLRTRSVKQ